MISYEGYDPFDGILRGNKVSPAVMEILAEHVKLARMRLASAHRSWGGMAEEEGEEEVGLDTLQPAPPGGSSSGAASGPKRPSAGALAEHVKRQIGGFDRPGEPGSGTDALAASAAAVERARLGTAASAVPLSFLQAASEHYRARDVDRRRNLVAASTAAATASAPASAAPPAAGGAELGAATSTGVAFSILFRYQEGFTNAVRRPVKLNDFLRETK